MNRLSPLLLVSCAFLFVTSPLLRAQSDSIPQPSPGSPEKVQLRAALQALVKQIEEYNQKITKTEDAIRTTPSDEIRSQLAGELRQLKQNRSEARLDLLDIVSDADLSNFEKVEEKAFTLQGSIADLIKPLVDEVRQATAGSRERRDLEDQLAATSQKTQVLKKALDSLAQALQTVKDPQVLSMLESVRSEYQKHYEDARNKQTVLRFRLDEIESQNQSLVEETRGFFASFFRERGRNLLIAVLAAVLTAISIRLFNLFLHNHTAIFNRGRGQASRLLDIALYIATFLGAFLAVLMVFLVVGDWVLLGLMILLVLGFIFAAKDALPGYMDEIRLLLNMGPVREGERLVFNGVPWMVENLTFFTILRNPALRGGLLRMPVAQLKGMLSRPATESEPYFPSEEGDWVLLDDDTYGQVVFQSVEMVRLQLRGGATKMYPASEYLEQNPRNHSHGYRLRTTIGIDYQHQPDVTGSILQDLNDFFREKLEAELDPAAIRALKVEFTYANSSSLDFVVLLDVDGSLAARFRSITRSLQRIGVDACNHFGWGIPFQQVTLHRASEEQAQNS